MSIRVITSTNIDDRHSNVTYAPEGQWTVHTNVQSIFHLYGNSDTFHDRQGATATVKFYGVSISDRSREGNQKRPEAQQQSPTRMPSNTGAIRVPIMARALSASTARKRPPSTRMQTQTGILSCSTLLMT
ncbi:hypothetical protein M408DRAFT_109912 [Serendipita vermifera MAFF 305830]|uniref:Uncharacterized protein n=1 Tax=Serendipita vermifera MAFF 305830 TaxID=933852 RepID=A0A0C3APV0_SERVB|nr:hypothetical protein M408DRAFT_109912 [Serendipita vermifera MAFF 305830]